MPSVDFYIFIPKDTRSSICVGLNRLMLIYWNHALLQIDIQTNSFNHPSILYHYQGHNIILYNGQSYFVKMISFYWLHSVQHIQSKCIHELLICKFTMSLYMHSLFDNPLWVCIYIGKYYIYCKFYIHCEFLHTLWILLWEVSKLIQNIRIYING